MFKKVIILLIAVICVSSGAFAIISNYSPENTNDSTNHSLVNDIKDISSSESFLNNIKNNNIVDGFKDYWQYTYGYLVNVDGELRHYINDNGAYYLESEGLTDRYIVCVECGGFVPIGEITNPLPKAAICHHNDIAPIFNLSDVTLSYSRDEAYNMWINESMPVYDDIHSEIDVNKILPIVSNDYTRCNECHGFGYLPDEALCHHYNGSLNVDEIPKDNLYSADDADSIFDDEWFALNEIISCDSLNYDDYHNYGKYIDFHNGFPYCAATYYDIVNYIEHHIKPEGNLSFVVENNNFNSSEEILDNSSNVFDIGNNTSIDTNIDDTVIPAVNNVLDDVVCPVDNEIYVDDFNQDWDNEEVQDIVDDYGPDNDVEIDYVSWI